MENQLLCLKDQASKQVCFLATENDMMKKKKKEKFLHKLPAMNLSKAMAVRVRYLNTKIRT